MKTILTLLLSFSSLAFAGNETYSAQNCLPQIQSGLSWNDLSLKEVQCLQTNEDFLESIRKLCSPNRETVSSAYAQYVAFERLDKEARAQIRISQDRSAAIADVVEVQERWTTEGQRPLISLSLQKLAKAHASCRR